MKTPNSSPKKKVILHGQMFSAPLPPRDVTGIRLHQYEDTHFEISFSEPAKGNWEHFELTTYKTNDDHKSTNQILKDEMIVLPMRVNEASPVFLDFFQLQTEYKLEVWTVSSFGRRSTQPAVGFIKTGERI